MYALDASCLRLSLWLIELSSIAGLSCPWPYLKSWSSDGMSKADLRFDHTVGQDTQDSSTSGECCF